MNIKLQAIGVLNGQWWTSDKVIKKVILFVYIVVKN